MKLYSSALSDLIKMIESGSVNATLLYGPNHGFVKMALGHIESKLNLTTSNFEYKEITPSKLELVANSKNFLGQKELIKITGVTSALNSEMKKTLENGDFYNIICFIAEDSLPASGIRKFFEDQKSLISIGCYYDNEQAIGKIILQQCSKRGKKITTDALTYLKSFLKGDHNLIKLELEKLFTYAQDIPDITEEHVIQVLSSDLTASGDEMCIFFAKKEPKKFLQEIDKLLQQGKNEILIIRALIRFYLNVYITISALEAGQNIDVAIKSLPSPIFFKYVNDFKQIVRKYTISDALNALRILQQAEIDYKTKPQNFDMFAVYLKLI